MKNISSLSKLGRAALKLTFVVSLGAVAMLDAAPAQAGSATANLNVSASVSANCAISTTALAFGAYDPVSANQSSPLAGTGGIKVTCTSGASATVTLGQGSNAATGSTDAAPLRQMNDGSSDNLGYALFQDSSHATTWGNTSGTGVGQTGTGAEANLTVYGTVAAGQNVPSGSYTDTVVATVSF